MSDYITEVNYRTSEGINASAITSGLKSMLHMHYTMTGGERADSPAMKFGRQAHMAVLEPRRWAASRNVYRGEGSKATKEYKAWAADIDDTDMIVTASESAAFDDMSLAIWQHKECAWLLDGCIFETPIWWDSDRYGRGKARIDAHKTGYIIDYKTTRSLDPRAFMRSAFNLNYHIRMGWYVHGWEMLTGERRDVVLIVQETEPPYDCYPMHMSDFVIGKGEQEAVDIAVRYHCCRTAGSFPGVASDMVEFELPAWAGGDEVNMEGVEL